MNRAVALLSSLLSAAVLASEPGPQNRDKPPAGATASVTVKLDGKGSIGLLATADRLEVEKYEKDLKCAGLTCEEISILIADEIQVRIAAAKAPPAPAGAPPASAFDGPGIGPYVRALVMQGVRGRALASAIHAEKARRRAAAVPAKGPGKAPPSVPGKTSDPGADRKVPPKVNKADASRPDSRSTTATRADQAPRPTTGT
jgi:hypothetical protein